MLVHGLVYDQPWQYEQPVIGPDSVSVTTYIDITSESPFYAAYPFESRLALTYTLTRDLVRTTYRVQNNGSNDLPFGFALHPYFSLLSGPQNTLISLPADEVMEADDMLLPTGRIFALDQTIPEIGIALYSRPGRKFMQANSADYYGHQHGHFAPAQ